MTLDTATIVSISQFVQREGILLDDRQWDQWLALYEPQTEYWVPMWDEFGEPTTDPQRELALIYYAARSGLEDRIFRIRTGRSSATMPLFRTSHQRTFPVCEQQADLITARFNWVTHAFRSGETQAYFGHKTLWLRAHEDSFRIAKSHTIVCNDVIDQVLDIYHL